MTKRYNIIYADPPWQYQNWTDSKQGAAIAQYGTESLESLKTLEASSTLIKDLADDNCVLFMWATFPKLKEAIELMEAWGFEYKTVAFVWVKKNKNGCGLFHGIGFHTASNVEIVLLGKRGQLKRDDEGIEQVIISPITTHSSKPKEVYTRIEKLYGNVPRIELFARHHRDGWDVWGNEAPRDVQKLIQAVID